MSFKVLTIFCLLCKSCRWIQSTGGATQMYKESVEAFRITRSKLTRIRVRPRDTFKNSSYKNWSFWIQLSSSKLCLYLDPTFPKDNQTAQWFKNEWLISDHINTKSLNVFLFRNPKRFAFLQNWMISSPRLFSNYMVAVSLPNSFFKSSSDKLLICFVCIWNEII